MRKGIEEEIITRISVQFIQFGNFQRSQSKGSNKWRNVYGMYLPSECLFKAIEGEKLVKRVGIRGIPGETKILPEISRLRALQLSNARFDVPLIFDLIFVVEK